MTNSQDFNIAKEKELESWEDNNIYEVVPYNRQKCISIRWVYSLKGNTDSTSKSKARSFARGFEEENLHEVPKDSPTCGKDALRVTLAILPQINGNLDRLILKLLFFRVINYQDMFT